MSFNSLNQKAHPFGYISPSQRIPVENETPLNVGVPIGEVSGGIQMCEEGVEKQTESLNNTELKNFFNNADEDDGGEIVEDAKVVEQLRQKKLMVSSDSRS